MTRFPVALVLVLVLPCASSSQAAVLLFIDNQAGFNTAVANAGLGFAGTEDWESSTLGPNLITSFPGPLAPGVANGLFPNGTNVATGLTVQENSLAGNPVNTTAPGNLATASAFLSGTPTDQVSTNATSVSFDMLFGSSNTTAVSFTPLIFDVAASGNAGTADIRVFDSSNTLLATQSVNVAGFMNPTTFIGVVSMFGQDIGRINVFATSQNDDFSGADNIDVYTGVIPDPNAPGPVIPEPASFIVWSLLAVIGLLAHRHRRRRA